MTTWTASDWDFRGLRPHAFIFSFDELSYRCSTCAQCLYYEFFMMHRNRPTVNPVTIQCVDNQ